MAATIKDVKQSTELPRYLLEGIQQQLNRDGVSLRSIHRLLISWSIDCRRGLIQGERARLGKLAMVSNKKESKVYADELIHYANLLDFLDEQANLVAE